MQEQYVSFNTAKLLKENGFDWECSHVYDTVRSWTCDDNKVYDNFGILVSAPTIDGGLKWLRDTHNVQVTPWKNKFGWHYDIVDLTNSDMTGCKKLFEQSIFENPVYKTYEDAAEAGINYFLTHDLKCIS